MSLIFSEATKKNIQKPLVFWYFQGVWKGTFGIKWVNNQNTHKKAIYMTLLEQVLGTSRLEQVFPCELSEIFSNYFVKLLRTAATVFCLFQVNKLIAIMLKDS